MCAVQLSHGLWDISLSVSLIIFFIFEQFHKGKINKCDNEMGCFTYMHPEAVQAFMGLSLRLITFSLYFLCTGGRFFDVYDAFAHHTKEYSLRTYSWNVKPLVQRRGSNVENRTLNHYANCSLSLSYFIIFYWILSKLF